MAKEKSPEELSLNELMHRLEEAHRLLKKVQSENRAESGVMSPIDKKLAHLEERRLEINVQGLSYAIARKKRAPSQEKDLSRAELEKLRSHNKALWKSIRAQAVGLKSHQKKAIGLSQKNVLPIPPGQWSPDELDRKRTAFTQEILKWMKQKERVRKSEGKIRKPRPPTRR